MTDVYGLKDRIRRTFAHVEFPGNGCPRGSNEGEEPYLLAEDFKDKDDWTKITAQFLDQAPDGYAAALNFFSDEAFQFYLPAYLIADIDGGLMSQDPSFQLPHGLFEASKDQKINPRRYGERTWAHHAHHKFAVFNQEQAAAIADYLAFKRDHTEMVDFEKERIDQALENYWLERAGLE